MSFSFDPKQGLVVVRARIEGPLRGATLRLALDTGATSTLINTSLLVAVGYDIAVATNRVEVTTGSGVEFAPSVSLSFISALGHDPNYFPVVGHTLPPTAGIDGVLGLDFVRELTLTVDFRTGEIDLI